MAQLDGAWVPLHPQAAQSPPSPGVCRGCDLASGCGRQPELAQATTLCMCAPSFLTGQPKKTHLPLQASAQTCFLWQPSLGGRQLFSWLLGSYLLHFQNKAPPGLDHI